MKLSQQEVQLFYELMFPLQFFVKQKLNLLRKIHTLNDFRNCSMQDKMEVRQALYDNIGLIVVFHSNLTFSL